MTVGECPVDHVNGPVEYFTCNVCDEVYPRCRACTEDLFGHQPCFDEPALAAELQKSKEDESAWEESDMVNELTVPRVAGSVDDLKPGQVVTQRVNGLWGTPMTITSDDIDGQIWFTKQFGTSPIFILEDPPPPSDFRVPAAEIEKLREAAEAMRANNYYHPETIALKSVARAVLDAAEEVTGNE